MREKYQGGSNSCIIVERLETSDKVSVRRYISTVIIIIIIIVHACQKKQKALSLLNISHALTLLRQTRMRWINIKVRSF